MTFDPEQDGITHINVYSKGRTELGRLMSNFAYSPFVHPEFGKFNSVEGFWYWLSVPSVEKADMLRELSGYEAKKLGRELRGKDWSPEETLFLNFREEIKKAISLKLIGNKRLQELLKESSLPFVHYYVMYDRILPQENDNFIMKHWEQLRKELKESK